MYPIKVRVSDFTFMSKDREIQNVYNCWTAVARKIKLHWKSTVTKYLFICKSRVFSRPSYPSSAHTHTRTSPLPTFATLCIVEFILRKCKIYVGAANRKYVFVPANYNDADWKRKLVCFVAVFISKTWIRFQLRKFRLVIVPKYTDTERYCRETEMYRYRLTCETGNSVHVYVEGEMKFGIRKISLTTCTVSDTAK